MNAFTRMNGHYSEQTDLKAVLAKASPDVRTILEKALAGEELTQPEAIVLFETEGADYSAVLKTADAVRQQRCGDEASFIVTRNINFTNVCYMGCSFCNFSVAKDDASAEFISFDEIADRAQEAWERGATEVCVQGGLHPDIDKDFYRNVLIAIKTRVPDMHIHAFSPFEIWYGSRKARMSPEDFLRDLKAHGLGSMPGTAAEILAPEVRKILTKDKLKTDEWVRIIKAAHSVGVPTTATIMYGHVDGPADWAYHLDLLRSIQKDTGGFTEFVPLGFIHYETPLYKENPDGVRTGPTRAEHFKMHEACVEALKNCEDKLKPGNKIGEVFDIHAKTFDDLGYNKARMNACGYSLGSTFSPNWMDWPMLYTGNPYIIQPGNVFFMHMILMDSENQLAMNLGETYLVTNDGNKRLGNKKLDLVVL